MNLVVESLNDLYKFQKNSNHLDNLGIGKKVIIAKWLNEMQIENYIINDDLTIHVNGHVDLIDLDLVEIPEYIQFSVVERFFTCSRNKLTTLKGCPRYVGGYFGCTHNNLTSLEYCPNFVGGDFICHDNNIKFTEDYVNNQCNVLGDIYVTNKKVSKF